MDVNSSTHQVASPTPTNIKIRKGYRSGCFGICDRKILVLIWHTDEYFSYDLAKVSFVASMMEVVYHGHDEPVE